MIATNAEDDWIRELDYGLTI